MPTPATSRKLDGANHPEASGCIMPDQESFCSDAPCSKIGRSIKKGDYSSLCCGSQVPPRLTDAISFAERIHVALVSRPMVRGLYRLRRIEQTAQGHKHAFILCESNLGLGKGRRGEITHVVVHAPMGFELQDRQALDGLSRVWGHGGHDIQLILLGVGQPEDFAGLDANKGESSFAG